MLDIYIISIIGTTYNVVRWILVKVMPKQYYDNIVIVLMIYSVCLNF